MMCDYLLVAPLSPEIQTENIHNAHSDELAGDETAYAHLACIFFVSPPFPPNQCWVEALLESVPLPPSFMPNQH